MRIAVDARELCHRPTGVGRYLGELLAEWSRSPDAARHEWTLYAHRRLHVPEPFKDRVRVVPGEGGTAWEQWNFARALTRDRPDVLFAPGYTAPLSVPAPMVLTVHDVSFFAHPEWFSFRGGARRRLITGWCARRARVVLTDSLFSQGELARYVGLPKSRVRVVHLGMRRGTPHVAATREPLVLYVGSIFDRRRVDRLIRSFDRVVDRIPAARLEIVGENRTIRPRVDLDAVRAQMRHGDHVTLRSYVDEATLHGLYARAAVFAFLSEYEGFGLTPLEALAAGIPPVVLDTAIAREICGPAARYVAPSAPTDDPLVEALVDLVANEASRGEILRHAPDVLARYDWSTTAAATLDAIAEAAGAR